MEDREVFFLVEESAEGGYEARALGYSIFTAGDTLEDLREAVRDAVRCHFDEKNLPRIIRLHFVKEEVIAV
ncbi:MAG TPA: 2-oxoisovalerate dehydrogenase [Firmicutes bacterium]|nr:2-oxoisovalerate dehydrogenase [Bacillota bacterium]HHY99052.1 2-oxoisovalerate dehydrogenase [Bacillota bacterium]